MEDKIKRKSWFEGVILAAALLESIGMAKLKMYYKTKAVNDLQTIDRLNCDKIVVCLFGLELVDQPTYSKMILIDRQREELVKRIVRATKTQFLLFLFCSLLILEEPKTNCNSSLATPQN